MKSAKNKRDKGSEHGGLDAWFKGHGQGKSKAKGKAPYGDWVAITPVKNTIEKDNGKKKTYEAGDIVGPCGISKDPEWKDITDNGNDPLKCMPRQKAHDLSKDERAELAKNKRKKEKSEPDSKKPVKTPTFGEKAKEIKKGKSISVLAEIRKIEARLEKESGVRVAGLKSEKWIDYKFDKVRSAETDEWKQFAKDFFSDIKKVCIGYELVDTNIWSDSLSGLLKKDNVWDTFHNQYMHKYFYFEISDVRGSHGEWFGNIIVRTAKDEDDVYGTRGRGHGRTSLKNLKAKLDQLLPL